MRAPHYLPVLRETERCTKVADGSAQDCERHDVRVPRPLLVKVNLRVAHKVYRCGQQPLAILDGLRRLWVHGPSSRVLDGLGDFTDQQLVVLLDGATPRARAWPGLGTAGLR